MSTASHDFAIDITDPSRTELSGTEPNRTDRGTRPATRRLGLARLVAVEIRKATDTRSGLALIGLGVAVTALALGFVLFRQVSPSFTGYAGFSPILGVVIPLIGLFSMTAEWTQRTALSTFLLSPRRGRVLAAKFAAALVLTWVVLAAVVALIAGAVALGAALQGTPADWTGMVGDIRGLYILTTLQVIMAAGFGALFAQTAVAVGAFLVAPTIWSIVGTLLFGTNALWLDVFAAQDRLMSSTPGELLPQTLVAVGVWIVLPAVVGIVRSVRREVK